MLIIVSLALIAGYVFKKYSDEGSLLGFKLEKVNKSGQYVAPTPRFYAVETPVIPPSVVPASLADSPVPEIPTITPLRDFSIKVINYPDKVKLNENTAFTWEINGPAGTTGYTAIVGSKESKPGSLAENIKLESTPYRVFTNEFINGTYQIPLVYVGNTVIPEYGIWYFRAIAVVGGKNIWSAEYSLRVE